MIDPYLGKNLVVCTNGGNKYSGLFVQIQILPPHKYIVLRLECSSGPFKKGEFVKINTDHIESFA